MKHLLLLSLLLLSLAGCKKADPDPVDPFLGHWQSDTQRNVYYDAKEQVTSDTNEAVRQDLDVTATTLTFTGYRPDGTPRAPSTGNYTRAGEELVIAGSSPVLVIYHVRALTATSFILQSDRYSTFTLGSPRAATSYILFHR